MNGTLFCNRCGVANAASAQFCGGCGASMGPTAAPVNPPAASVNAPASAPQVAYAAAGAYPVVQTGARYGGFWIRVVAFIIDAILVRVVVHPVAAIFGLAAGGVGMNVLGMHGFRHGMSLPLLIFGGGVLAVLTIGASWLYEALMESSSYQATLGKMIFGMKVTDLYGNRISFARATGRHFAKWLSGMILVHRLHHGRPSPNASRDCMILLAGTLVRRT